MKTIVATLTLALGALAALAGTAPAQVAHTLPSTVTTDTVPDVLTVQNDRRAPAIVYMEDRVGERRLGVVPGFQTAELPLPRWAVRGHDDIQLLIQPEGSVDALETAPFTLSPPGRVAMMIPPWGVGGVAATDAMTAVIPPADLGETTITVENPRDTPVTIYAERDVADRDLGTVPARGEATLVLPRWMVSPDASVRLFVQPKHGLELSSELLTVTAGEHLGLRVPLH